MSHPNPHYDPENSYPSDDYKPVSHESPVSKLKRLVGESQEIRKGNLTGKKKAVAKKMKPHTITTHKAFRKFLKNSGGDYMDEAHQRAEDNR